MAQKKFYKLSKSSSLFYDSASKLKVTSNIPGVTEQTSKAIKEAIQNGHIISITEAEYNQLMDKLPTATKDASLAFSKSSSKPVVKKEEPKVEETTEEEPEEESDDDADERAELLKQLEDFELSKKDRKKLSEGSLENLRKFLADNA